jgi:hypothetical protein
MNNSRKFEIRKFTGVTGSNALLARYEHISMKKTSRSLYSLASMDIRWRLVAAQSMRQANVALR